MVPGSVGYGFHHGVQRTHHRLRAESGTLDLNVIRSVRAGSSVVRAGDF